MALATYAVRKFEVKQSEQNPKEHYTVQIAKDDKPVQVSDRLAVIVEEEVMRWKDADHIHGWFVNNVQSGKDDHEEHSVGCGELRQLLEVCEKVLNGSHLVIEPAFKATDWSLNRKRMDSPGGPSKVIKNVSIAHRLLPRWGDSDAPIEYGEAYLRDVQATRDWAESMLRDQQNGVRASIYYRSGWRY